MPRSSTRYLSRFSVVSAALATVATIVSSPVAQAVNVTWDTVTGDGAAVTAGNGTWDLTGTNTIWNNATTNVAWTNTAPTNTAIFAGADGTYAVTVGGAVITENGASGVGGLRFINSGYTLSAAAATTVQVGTGAAFLTVASGKSATIGSNVTVTSATSGQTLTIDGGGTLNILGTGSKVQAENNLFNIVGGSTVNVGTNGTLSAGNSQFVVGTAAGNGTVIVNGGTVTSASTTATHNFILANNTSGTVSGTLTINSGNVLFPAISGGLRFGSASAGTGTSNGTFNLNGGTLEIGRFFEGGGAGNTQNSTVNLNGGTIKVRAGSTNASNFMIVDNAIVQDGGAKFDTNGVTTTISQVLQHGGVDATDGGLVKQGTDTLILTGNNTYNGLTNIQGGTLSLGRVGGTILDTANVQVGSGTLDVAQADTIGTLVVSGGTVSGASALTASSYDIRSGTISGNLAGSGALTKSTSGTATISGNSTYTGATTVNAGLLNISGTVTSPISVSSGGSLGGEGSTNGNVVLGAGSSFVFDPTTVGANQYFRTSGNIDTTAGASTKININVSQAVSSGSGIVVFEGGSITTNGLSDFKLGSRGTLSLTSTQLLFNYSAGSVVWKGANGTNPTFWDINTTPNNFTLGGVDDFYYDGDNVTFDDTASSFNVVIQGPQVNPGNIVVDNTTNAYSISGVIAGTATLTKNGTNTLTLVGNSTYTGGTTINAGAIRLGNGTSTGSVVGAITNNSSLIVDAGANNITVSNDVGGTGALTKNGSGTVTVTGSNTYAGTTTISAGTLQVGNGGTVGVLGTGAIANNGTLIFNRSDDITVSNAISGTGAVTKLGATTLTLGANTYDGLTTISAGGVVVTADGALGTATGNTNIAPNSALGLSGGITYATAEKIVGSGVGTLVANTGAFTSLQRGLVQSISGNNTFNGPIEINASGNTRFGTQNGASLTLNGPITVASGVTGVNVVFRTGIDGDWVTVGNSGNSWDGLTTIFSNATDPTNGSGVKLGANNALSTTSKLQTGGNTTGIGTTLDLNGYSQTFAGIVFSNGRMQVINRGATLSTLTLNLATQNENNDGTATRLITIEDGPSPDPLTGANQVALVKTGSFAQILVGVQNYSGATTINGGTLKLAQSTNPSFPTTTLNPLTKVSVATGAKFQIATGQPLTIAGLTGAGQVMGGNATSSELTVNVAATETSSFTGTIGGTGTNENNLALTKSGAGTLNLAGTYSYTGVTTVNDGKLITTAALQQPTSISINNGAILEVPVNGTSSAVTAVNGIATSGTGSRMQLHDNDLVVNYGSNPTVYSDVVNQVKSGLALLGGTGTEGISSAEVDAQTIQGTILAVVDDGDANIAGAITATSGYTLAAPTSSVIVKFTWFGDSNLDGVVDGSDYALLDSGFTSGGSLGGWVFGDYDYSGQVDGSDYALIDTGFISQNAVLPEPTTLGLLGIASLSMMRRRRV